MAASATRRLEPVPRCDVTTTYLKGSFLSRDLNLPGPDGFDPRPVALLDKPAHPDAGALKLFRVHAGGFKCAQIAA
jgi:hypothetical protein